jgi:hypothetical protein
MKEVKECITDSDESLRLFSRIDAIHQSVLLPSFLPSFLPLGVTAEGELWPPEQPASILLYSEADCLVSEQFSCYGVKFLASLPTPKLEDRVSLFVRLLPLDLSGMGDPTSSYATAGIALSVSGALKPHHHGKVGPPR